MRIELSAGPSRVAKPDAPTRSAPLVRRGHRGRTARTSCPDSGLLATVQTARELDAQSLGGLPTSCSPRCYAGRASRTALSATRVGCTNSPKTSAAETNKCAPCSHV